MKGIFEMASATKIKKSVAGYLADWEALKLKALKIEQSVAEEIAEHKAKFEKACEPIKSKAQAKLKPLYDSMVELEAEIAKEFKAGISVDGETVALSRVESILAVAELKDNGKREINPETFFKEIAAADRGASFWGCVQVLIGKAEKFLAEEAMKRLAKHDHKYAVNIRLKQ